MTQTITPLRQRMLDERRQLVVAHVAIRVIGVPPSN